MSSWPVDTVAAVRVSRSSMFFESWTGLTRTIVVGGLAYASLVLMLRISGKRTLAKMNSFDLAVTVALGSTLASMLLNKQVPLVEGLLAFALLIVLQFIITWLSVRADVVRRIVRSEPRLLFYRGEFLGSAMRTQRITKPEVMQEIRSRGVHAIGEAEGVVIETNGTLSVICRGEAGDRSSLAGLVPSVAANPSQAG